MRQRLDNSAFCSHGRKHGCEFNADNTAADDNQRLGDVFQDKCLRTVNNSR